MLLPITRFKEMLRQPSTVISNPSNFIEKSNSIAFSHFTLFFNLAGPIYQYLCFSRSLIYLHFRIQYAGFYFCATVPQLKFRLYQVEPQSIHFMVVSKLLTNSDIAIIVYLLNSFVQNIHIMKIHIRVCKLTFG